MIRYAIRLMFVALTAVCGLRAQPAGFTGQWIEPTGSVIRIDGCGERICMWVVAISPKAQATVDIHNPDPAKRTRPLCGLQIGSGFVVRTPNEARDGTLYDPKTGKTYHGNIKLDGNNLELRGFVGIPLFGESQTWTRLKTPINDCVTGKM